MERDENAREKEREALTRGKVHAILRDCESPRVRIEVVAEREKTRREGAVSSPAGLAAVTGAEFDPANLPDVLSFPASIADHSR
jgi:hypothetical protein